MRKWIDAVSGEPATKQTLNEGPFDFIKGLGGQKAAPAPKRAAIPPRGPDHFSKGAFGKRPIAGQEGTDEEKMGRALQAVAQTVSWAGVAGAGETIAAAAAKYGVDPAALKARITPDMVRNWQRNFD